MFLVFLLLVVLGFLSFQLGFLSFQEGFSSKDYELQNEEKDKNYQALQDAFMMYDTILDLKI
jgi:predicted RND superfamily exporter protein